MSNALGLIERLGEIGATVEQVGDRLVLRAGPTPIPAELVRHVRKAKFEILAAIVRKPACVSGNVKCEATWWHSQFAVRTMHRELGDIGAVEARHLAFGDMMLEWHLRYGARPDPRRCAGCGGDLAGAAGLFLCDGARVHLDGVRGVNCVIAYGEKWRGAAVVELGALGIDPPQGFTP